MTLEILLLAAIGSLLAAWMLPQRPERRVRERLARYCTREGGK